MQSAEEELIFSNGMAKDKDDLEVDGFCNEHLIG